MKVCAFCPTLRMGLGTELRKLCGAFLLKREFCRSQALRCLRLQRRPFLPENPGRQPSATSVYLICDHRYKGARRALSRSSSSPDDAWSVPWKTRAARSASDRATEQPAGRQRQLVDGSRHCFSPGDPAPSTSGCVLRGRGALPQLLVLVPTLGRRLPRVVAESWSRVSCRVFPVAPVSGDRVINLL